MSNAVLNSALLLMLTNVLKICFASILTNKLTFGPHFCFFTNSRTNYWFSVDIPFDILNLIKRNARIRDFSIESLFTTSA